MSNRATNYPTWFTRRPRPPAIRDFRRVLSAGEPLEARALLSFDPSALEQLMLEDINRFRADPQAELRVLFTDDSAQQSEDPEIQKALDFFNVDSRTLLDQWAQLEAAPPLAWSAELYEAATAHNELMVQLMEQSHQLPDEPELGDRVRQAGFEWTRVSENVFAFASSTLHAHAAFVVDWGKTATGIQSPPGHRENILDQRIAEVGISIDTLPDSSEDFGPLIVTQDFGLRRDQMPWIVGVVYFDENMNGSYDGGEGLGDIEIVATDGQRSFRTTSMSAGGYQLDVPAGIYTLRASGTPTTSAVTVSDISIGGVNVKVDLTPGPFELIPGDSNQDGSFDRQDIVLALQAGKFGTGADAVFVEGDWNNDGVFDQFDIVLALQAGRFQNS